MWIVALDLKILINVILQPVALGDNEARQRARFLSQLLPDLIEVVSVDVEVAEGDDEVSRLHAGDARQHGEQGRVTGDVEGQTEVGVDGAGVEVEGELLGGPIRASAFLDVALPKGVAWGQTSSSARLVGSTR